MKAITLTEISENWKKNENNPSKKIRLGIRILRGPVSHHHLILLKGLNQFNEISGFGLARREDYEKEITWFKQIAPQETLITYDKNETELLNEFNIVFLPESNFEVYEEYPKELIKIGLPHGVDIPLRQTIMEYGGGMIFDYILSPKNESPKEKITAFQDLYPRELRNHTSDYVCHIPFGFPKLDEFLNAVTRVPQAEINSIAYHVALLSLEEEKSIHIIEPTLLKLLENFPNHRIIFRPYKYDYQHKTIKRCIEIGKSYHNFYLSTAESYVSDYSTAMAMVCHRAYKAHLFSLATGRPIFLCHPDGNPTTSQDPSAHACSESDLVENIKTYIDKNEVITATQRTETCKNIGFHNPGSSVDYLIKNIHHILENKPNKEWTYHKLDSDHKPFTLRTYTALEVISTTPANMALRFMASKHPSNYEILLFLADSYSRKNIILNYYSKLSFKCFHKLMTTNEISHSLREAAQRWWKTKGRSLLNHIYDNHGIDPQISIDSTDSLSKEFLSQLLLATKGIQKEVELKFPEYEILIDLDTYQPVTKYSALALYGARKLAKKFIDNQSATTDIRMVVDPDHQIIGTKVGKFTVQPVNDLHSCNAPVLICSFTYLLESFLDLRKKLGPERKLYAICRDQQILDLLPLLQEN